MIPSVISFAFKNAYSLYPNIKNNSAIAQTIVKFITKINNNSNMLNLSSITNPAFPVYNFIFNPQILNKATLNKIAPYIPPYNI